MLEKEFNECFENNEFRKKMLEHFKESSKGEKHHIVPRSYFKKTSKKIINENNLIKVDYLDHLWIHYYAWKCAKPIIKKEMAAAINIILKKYKGEPLEEILKDYALIREELAEKAKRQKTNKKIICLETKEVFNSLGEAERKTNIDKRLISNVCNLKRKIAGGYHWSFLENYHDGLLEEIVSSSDKTSFKKRKVICLETGEIFESSREASKKFNIDFRNLSCCLTGNSKTAGGYHWSFWFDNIICSEEILKIEKKLLKRDRTVEEKKLYKCVENGNIYRSIYQAAKELNISQPYLRRRIMEGKSAKGFTFLIF